MNIDAIMRTAPVIPVLVIDDIANAVPIAEALVAGGLLVLEVTLRTPVGHAHLHTKRIHHRTRRTIAGNSEFSRRFVSSQSI